MSLSTDYLGITGTVLGIVAIIVGWFRDNSKDVKELENRLTKLENDKNLEGRLVTLENGAKSRQEAITTTHEDMEAVKTELKQLTEKVSTLTATIEGVKGNMITSAERNCIHQANVTTGILWRTLLNTYPDAIHGLTTVRLDRMLMQAKALSVKEGSLVNLPDKLAQELLSELDKEYGLAKKKEDSGRMIAIAMYSAMIKAEKGYINKKDYALCELDE